MPSRAARHTTRHALHKPTGITIATHAICIEMYSSPTKMLQFQAVFADSGVPPACDEAAASEQKARRALEQLERSARVQLL